MINFCKELKPGVLLFVSQKLKLKILLRMFELISANLICPTEILQVLKANFSSNITPKEPSISLTTKVHELF